MQSDKDEKLGFTKHGESVKNRFKDIKTQL